MTRPPPLGRILRSASLGALTLSTVAVVGGGCLDRPVAPATPVVNARVVERAKQNKVSKIDLLFMIDNSSSMADKQAILAFAVPDLVNRLINPVCIDPKTGVQVGTANPDGSCTVGERDFQPIEDIHIGIITSSLGSHGAAQVQGSGICDDDADKVQMRANPHNDDRGHLVARDSMDAVVPTFQSKGFLNWLPKGGGATQPNDIINPFATMVKGVGQHGCGYEASLEAVYRFLIDPEPYDKLTVDGAYPGRAKLSGIDQGLLTQRADFLRPDSLVAVIIMSDENDCSVVDGEQGFYPLLPPSGDATLVPRGTSACKANPNDKCCVNCSAGSMPAGCSVTNTMDDVECQRGPYTKSEDQQNLRCFKNKQRYGVDFLYPVQRYIDGFKNIEIEKNGKLVKNPLFDDLQCKGVDCAAARDKGLVFVAGIVGVPWQDIAVDPKDLTKGLKSAQQLTAENVWATILGDPDNPSGPVLPTDLHMIESIEPRAGLAGPMSSPNQDPIHGHEWDPSKDPVYPNADLQYACIFPLTPPKTCTTSSDCDCFASDATLLTNLRNPLCQSAGGTYTTQQTRAKGYPGTRHLQVLKGLEDQAIVASICPGNTLNDRAGDFGYRPAVGAIISRLRNALRGRCLPRPIELRDDGTAPCVIVEAFTPTGGGGCVCDDKPGRVKAGDDVVTAEVKANASCFCEIQQLEDPNDLAACQTSLTIGGNVPAGWCYVDPSQGDKAQCPIVQACAATERRIIRFVNTESEPRTGATAFIMCQEKSFDPGAGASGADPCAMP